jgi:hypothetical protein
MIEAAEQVRSVAEYDALPGLSNSGMRDLAVSPLRYWYLHINPDRPQREETPQMRLGSALHCAVLESGIFLARYCRELVADEIEGCLVTVDDIRQFIRDKGCTPKGTRKGDLVSQATEIDPFVPVLDVLRERDATANAGKIRLSADEWERVHGCRDALLGEPRLKPILRDGKPEAWLAASDPDTGIPLKGRADWIAPNCILDIKTFSQQRGKSIDRCVADAIWNERYYRQAWLYSHLDGLMSGRHKHSAAQTGRDFVMAFVESEPPHEVRLKVLRAKTAGNPNLYWTTAMHEARMLMRVYADCQRRFGTNPWRMEQDIDPLIDEEIPQLIFSQGVR